MRVFAILIAMTFCAGASGKCLTHSFEVNGTVSDWSGRAIAGAVIAASWVERGRAQGPVVAHSDSAGHYSLNIMFSTYTKGAWFRGDVCKEKLAELAVSASAPGLVADPTHIAVQGSAITANLSLKATAPTGAAP